MASTWHLSWAQTLASKTGVRPKQYAACHCVCQKSRMDPMAWNIQRDFRSEVASNRATLWVRHSTHHLWTDAFGSIRKRDDLWNGCQRRRQLLRPLRCLSKRQVAGWVQAHLFSWHSRCLFLTEQRGKRVGPHATPGCARSAGLSADAPPECPASKADASNHQNHWAG